ncbi:ataxin-2-like protein isoform X2 [Dreissena polymorpha]|uniref:ataxin-2-like protein isoform X2 n=1 Tax=Dreissena polymorpha TaxID=45954 RepID=UPI0022647503|nr:ataxin-2-like protein isoform X2 [Dreissena polymorpha]
MSMMNTKTRSRGGGRMNQGGHPGSRNDKRHGNYPQDRPIRSNANKQQSSDRNVPMEGIYKNQRYTHVVVSLIGLNVQLTVKNGRVYEGVFKTMSNQGDVALEVVHVVEEGVPGQAPSKEQILSKLVVKAADVACLTAANVDLDYAVKDTFTDGGISKFNGESVSEKELEPWEADHDAEQISWEAEGDNSNGWDADEMFQTNARQFNVTSSYDDSLAQYTTKLTRGNSEEYRRREEHARKLAAEIEQSPTYKKNAELENINGDDDEEAKFSAVVRPNDGDNQSSYPATAGSNKYVPPNKRQGPPVVGSKSGRGGSQGAVGSRSAMSTQPYPPAQLTSQHSSESVNGEEPIRTVPASTAGPTVRTTSRNMHEAERHVTSEKKQRDLEDLKSFGSNFKLAPNANKELSESERHKEKDINRNVKEQPSETKDTNNRDISTSDNSSVVSETATTISVSRGINHVENMKNTVVPERNSFKHEALVATSQSMEQSSGGVSSSVDADFAASETSTSSQISSTQTTIVVNSNLRAEAQEFVPRSSLASHQQVPTPPQQPTPTPNQTVLYYTPQMTQMPPVNQVMVQQQQFQVKRADVSVKNMNATAMQKTGQPLLAHNHVFMVQQPVATGYNHGQMITMPPPTQQRIMSQPSMHPGVVPSPMSGPQSIDLSQPMYIGQQGPMPAHMNQQWQMYMSSQHASQPMHNNPAPSPVHTNPTQVMNPGPHPPSSGTPQPQQGYPQNPHQPHPPLQPSPHNQPSPQNMQPYNSFTSHGVPPMQMQGSIGSHQFPMPQHSSVPTSVTYSMQGHQHHNSNQLQHIVMMPSNAQHPGPSGQMGQHHHHHHNMQQFAGHHMPSGIQQPHLVPQSGMQGMPSQGPSSQQHMSSQQMPQYIHGVQHPGGQHIPSYQPSQ